MFVPHVNTTLACDLAIVNVTLHDAVERSVVDSAGFLANDAWLEKHSRNGNVRGDSDDVPSESMWVCFLSELSAVDLSSVSQSKAM